MLNLPNQEHDSANIKCQERREHIEWKRKGEKETARALQLQVHRFVGLTFDFTDEELVTGFLEPV